MQKEDKKEALHLIDKLKKEVESITEELKNDVTVPLIASFGFVIALVWRDAFRSIIDEILMPLNIFNKAYLYDLVSAIIITIIASGIIIWFTKIKRKKKKQRLEKIVEKDIKKLEEKIENKPVKTN